MAVKLNEDKEVVKTVQDGLKRTGGYCPCRLEKTQDTKCMAISSVRNSSSIARINSAASAVVISPEL